MIDLFQGNRPSRFYQLLPHLYAAAGALAMLALRIGLAIFSGLLLITAGAYYCRTNSTRRFWARPISLALSATGLAEPNPLVCRRPTAMPAASR
jgi:hypothetical protein